MAINLITDTWALNYGDVRSLVLPLHALLVTFQIVLVYPSYGYISGNIPLTVSLEQG